jgi:hypothetical protein
MQAPPDRLRRPQQYDTNNVREGYGTSLFLLRRHQGPCSKVEGLFTLLMCANCQAGHGSGPYLAMTRAEMRAGLDLLPTWAPEQKANANCRVIAIMRQRLAAGEQVARVYQEPGWRGWSGKPRPPRSWSPTGRQPSATARRRAERPDSAWTAIGRSTMIPPFESRTRRGLMDQSHTDTIVEGDASVAVAEQAKRLKARGAPKWEAEARDRLRAAVRRFGKPLADLVARDANEGDTRLLVTDFLCDGLGYDKYADLTTEYQVKGEFADYGLRIDRDLVAFIEVKRIATKLSTKHLRQVEMYAVNEGVEWVILTNGSVWQVYHITGGLPVVIDLSGLPEVLSVTVGEPG